MGSIEERIIDFGLLIFYSQFIFGHDLYDKGDHDQYGLATWSGNHVALLLWSQEGLCWTSNGKKIENKLN